MRLCNTIYYRWCNLACCAYDVAASHLQTCAISSASWLGSRQYPSGINYVVHIVALTHTLCTGIYRYWGCWPVTKHAVCTALSYVIPLALLMSDCLRSRRLSSQYRFPSTHTNKLIGVMWRVLHGPNLSHTNIPVCTCQQTGIALIEGNSAAKAEQHPHCPNLPFFVCFLLCFFCLGVPAATAAASCAVGTTAAATG